MSYHLTWALIKISIPLCRKSKAPTVKTGGGVGGGETESVC